jgi:hypothetical protein
MTAVNQVQSTPDELAALFGFTLEELAQNRAGHFSDGQRQTLFFQSGGYLVRGLALIALTVVLAAAVADTIHTRWQIAGFVLLGLLIMGIIGLWLRAAYLVMFPHVEMITGTLSRGSDDWHPSIFAGTVELRISFRRWKRLKESYPGLYRFYVSPTGVLLSVEPLMADDMHVQQGAASGAPTKGGREPE